MTKLQDVFRSVSVWVECTPKPDPIVQNDLRKSFFFFKFTSEPLKQYLSKDDGGGGEGGVNQRINVTWARHI